MTRHVRQFGALALVAGLALAAACGGAKGTRPVGKYCVVKKSANWEVSVSSWQPPLELKGCPHTLNRNGTYRVVGNVTFLFDFTDNGGVGPASHLFEYWTKRTRDTVTTNVRDPFIQSSGSWRGHSFSTATENGASHTYQEQRLALDVLIGLPPEQSDSLYQLDSLWAEYNPNPTRSGGDFGPDDGIGMFVSTVKRGVGFSQTTGPQGLTAGSSGTWSHAPASGDDTLGYHYQWNLDGSALNGDSGAVLTRTFANAGTYVLRLDQYLVDTVFRYTTTVVVGLATSISGQSVLSPYQNYFWTASSSGGTGPYTYEWYLDASYVQGGSTYSNAFNANESHWFDVKITDTNGNIGWGSFQFYTTNDGGGQGQLRLPAPERDPEAWRTRKLPPGMPRRPH